MKKLITIILLLLLPTLCFGWGIPGMSNPAKKDLNMNNKNITGANQITGDTIEVETNRTTANDGQHYSNPGNSGYPDAGILSDGAFGINRATDGIVYQKSGTERAYFSFAFNETIQCASPTALWNAGIRSLYVPVPTSVYPKGLTLTSVDISFGPNRTNLGFSGGAKNIKTARMIWISETYYTYQNANATSFGLGETKMTALSNAENTTQITATAINKYFHANSYIQIPIPWGLTWTYNMIVNLIGYGRGF